MITIFHLKSHEITSKKWASIQPAGLYCKPGELHIDPRHAVENALITHGHADHARTGHKNVFCTFETKAIMQVRYGEECAQHFYVLNYHESFVFKKLNLTLLPAGHILGSAQALIEYQGSTLLVSGDYKRAVDPTCPAFVAQHADVFITEATFSLPVFRHPLIESELKKLLESMVLNPQKAHLIGAYALGKCQRIIKTLRQMGIHQPIYLHGALMKLCTLYQSLGIDLGEIRPATELNLHNASGQVILCPPSSLNDRWCRRFGETVICLASGWMQIRARAKQKGIDLPLVISDHADWNELTQTIHDVNPTEVWVTHGREEALVHYAQSKGYQAQALHLLGYDDNED